MRSADQLFVAQICVAQICVAQISRACVLTANAHLDRGWAADKKVGYLMSKFSRAPHFMVVLYDSYIICQTANTYS